MRHLHTFILVAGLLSAGAVSEARQTAPQRPATPSAPQRPSPPSTGPQQPSPGPAVLVERPDARETRDRLNELFQQYPPSVREVLRIDPTLMYRPDYMTNYPVLAAFLEQHPEVAHNPGFFVGEWQSQEQNNNPQMEGARGLRNFIEGLTALLIIMTITTGAIFLVRTVVEHRRWQRAMKAQAELNTKLIDRFAASDELLAYLQSAPGKALTEMPALPQPSVRGMDAPLGRIFWSLQAGSVLAFAGAGLLFVSGRMRDDFMMISPTIFAFGTVVLTVGVGFLASSAFSFFLSQRLGLVRPLSARYSGEAPGS